MQNIIIRAIGGFQTLMIIIMMYSLLRSGKCQYCLYQWRCFLPSAHEEQRVTSKNKSVQNYRWIHAVHGWIQNKLFTFASRLEYVCVVRSCVTTAYTLLFKIRSSQWNVTNVRKHVIKKFKNAFGSGTRKKYHVSVRHVRKQRARISVRRRTSKSFRLWESPGVGRSHGKRHLERQKAQLATMWWV